LSNFSSSPGVVIIFTSSNCPYDEYYQDRIHELATTYNDRVPVLLINSNQNESLEHKKKHAIKFKVPYLTDHDQKAMVILSPRKNPEAFLLQNKEGKFNIVYRGAIDDNPQSASEVNQTYLKNSIENFLSNGKVELRDVRPVGCSIRKN
jgi:hypothetical protein